MDNYEKDWEGNSNSTSDFVQPQFSNPESAWGNLDEDFSAKRNIEDEMLTAFAGKNHEKIFTSKTNWAAAVSGQAIGPVWFFFRKCPLFGFAFLFVTYLIGSIASAINVNEASYIMFVIYLFAANPIYIWDAKRKIRKIIDNNPGANDEMLVELAKKKGGTSILATVIYCILFLLFMFGLMFLATMAVYSRYGLLN